MARILIIDDSRTSRKILRQILEEIGHEIVGEAVDGEDGVQKFTELQPELVTMDITMPVMDGLDALRRIIELDKNAKVVMITAAGQKNKILDSVRAGAVDFVSKPLDKEQIAPVLHKALQQ